MKILIVDDELVVARTLSLIFEKHGFEVTTAYSAGEALIAAMSQVPDLVICDIDMPGRDGVDLMLDLGRELPGCPILVLTGLYGSLGRVQDTAKGLRQKVQILTKPCQPAELLREAGTMLKTA
ncbi:response regulator [Granulicella tundricola]|uniref:Response regulator receiver protein n=1 Tax=Granulicella tundricola (strain ATCC BAA-1859 / DSM 23138 / MP5ACTX9) TaxID=1198114 RepID=E8X091_GRATM|nr:response regulator [Granulicella tundricola]ADW70072.1 response regulator receiver protein [Granulicella tundricola MP5ACTX9]